MLSKTVNVLYLTIHKKVPHVRDGYYVLSVVGFAFVSYLHFYGVCGLCLIVANIR